MHRNFLTHQEKKSNFSSIDSFFELNFKVFQPAAPHGDQKNDDDIKSYNLVPIALFSECKFYTSVGKHLKRIN